MKKSIIIFCSVAALFFAVNLTSCSSGEVDQAAVNKMADSLLNIKKTALMDSLHMANMAACQDSMNAWGEKMHHKGTGGGHSSSTKPTGMQSSTTVTSTPTDTKGTGVSTKGGGTVTTKGGGTGTTPVVTHKGDPPKQ